ncbi:MAG: NUDIX hydrolase [Acidobacteria bacterium]|nr:NUDIX hydrolase [Acidobacteriota bacterium]
MMNNVPAEQENTVLYREVRRSMHGEELRWLVSREQIRDAVTGQVHERSYIRHPGICVIVPFLGDDKIVLLRQFRPAIKQELWELPAGTLAGREENQVVITTESAELCAHRELIEESGYEAGSLAKFAECYAIPGSGDELMHFFYAFDLKKREQALDIGEAIHEVKPFSLTEIEAMITQGEIRDAKSLVGLFYALRRKS